MMARTWATLETTGGKAVLRFERRLGHAPDKVWQAITEPAELKHWFPAEVAYDDTAPGTELRFDLQGQDTTGEILEYDPPKVFAYRWQDDVMRFEVIADGDGCRLLFSHTIDESGGGVLAAGRNAAGWDTCLDGLAARLGSREQQPPEDMFAEMEAYLRRFGLSQGQVTGTGDERVIRFARDLVWRPAERIWATLTGGEEPEVGAPPPTAATVAEIAAGPVTEVKPHHVLEYQWSYQGQPRGRVRWEITVDPKAGHRIVLTQELPEGLTELEATALAAWQRRLEELFAALA
jgi:uncharacterized protein YndB with AHSA1/START domain